MPSPRFSFWAVQAVVTTPIPFDRSVGAMLMTVILAMFLVGTLLGLGFLILNVGLLSKRREDHRGKSAPSDIHVLKESLYPGEPDDQPSIEELEQHSAEAFPARVVGKIGESLSQVLAAVETAEGGVSGSEAQEAGGIGSPEPTSPPPEERPSPSKKVS